MKNNTVLAPFMPDEGAPYIFISYAHADRALVFPIIRRLYEQGWRIWYDEGLELGADYYGSLRSHIAGCSLFLLFDSPNARSSYFITQCEIPQARQFRRAMAVIHLTEDASFLPEVRVHTDDAGLEAALRFFPLVTRTEPRQAVGHVVRTGLLQRPDGEYTFEKCADGVRLLGCGDPGADLCLPEEYPPFTGARVTELEAHLFWKHETLTRVLLPRWVKTVDLCLFLNNRGLRELSLYGATTLTNRLGLSAEKLPFTVRSAPGSPAEQAAAALGLPFEADETLAFAPEPAARAFVSYSGTDCGDSVFTMAELELAGCRCVDGFAAGKNAADQIRSCGCFIAFVNSHYLRDRLHELRLALSLGKRIAVYQLEECPLPADLESLQTLHQLRYNTGSKDERTVKLINWLTDNGCRDAYALSDFSYRVEADGIHLTEYHGRYPNVQVPASHCGVEVVSLSAFYRCMDLRSVKLPATLRCIGDMAFCGCSSLRSLVIPEGVREIGTWAFKDCTALRSVTLPDSVTKMGSSVFDGCSNLHTVRLPAGIPVATGVFRGWPNLRRIEIPEAETEIAVSAFQDCTGLAEVKLHRGVTRVYSEAFRGCTALEEIVFPETVKIITGGAFRDCANLKKVVLPGNTRFLPNAFEGCPRVTVWCTAGSAVQEICEKKQIPYKLL